jgi:hypothetical protein
MLILTILFIIGTGMVFFVIFSQKQTTDAAKSAEEHASTIEPAKKTCFRWNYILLPLSILLISIVVSIVFYGKLPADVVYNFRTGDAFGRNIAVIWALVPQVLLASLSVVIALGSNKLSTLIGNDKNSVIKFDTILLAMSNMVAIPQLILFFTILNIFSYNAFQRQLSFLWILTLIILLIGLIILGMFFIRTINKVRKDSK